ncbi:basic transcription factor 3b, putative [Plasmodium knowlesi strain H]|uniref:Nascent polypeptide-associated complex subunit beta n=3 Tax=Plasmodium knowlesi TaxID=5850 RepID=A0A5K1VMR6_PLAKH|nr:transcription factor BTF3, putative [Plasmodium knowlesi strain H]OTN67737.1 Nascent polypeptide-associated complex subunit beta [Plasmodium knowlesi]CAA9990362.1 transcription factor BTF3, putative [Plasmodium knowlesi strain H]SBO19568.1 basic transcription factor 3b, putative [Plasmodium knowlesi strain H]SBO22697.1 basic transcription factor 3b, putative [Plasmodium knowlesi strain H]VVS79836.1 transcription factor BTF3, putative [Plasmodium knowlesi strain H]|eukprot:XP_002260762.1 basictranscription factor 3b, putative [Plasmodium knowlesi strain H]
MDKISPEILAARAKLKEKMGGNLRQIGGKGSARRKIKKVHKNSMSNEKKINLILKKIGASYFGDVDEICIYKAGDTYMEFKKPKLSASLQSNTYVVTGKFTEQKIDINKIFEGLKGNKNVDMNLLEKIKNDPNIKNLLNKENNGNAKKEDAVEESADVPDLVENFEEVSKEEEK